MNMERIKSTIAALLVASTVAFSTGCDGKTEGNSGEDPIPSEFVGWYREYMYGEIYVSPKGVSSPSFIFPICKVDGKDKRNESFKWDETDVNYRLIGTEAIFEFSPMLIGITTNTCGTADLSGTWNTNGGGNRVAFHYYPGETMYLSKNS